jgi:dUTP pyrophosphatase
MTSFENIRVYKINKESKIPTRAHASDAGVDIYYISPTGDSVNIHPGETTLLPSGVKIQVPEGCMLQIMNKSGVAYKRRLLVGACVVDEGYTGEIFVNLHNVGKETQTILSGQKIAQGVFVKIMRPELVETAVDQIYDNDSHRGHGALGSTGDY